MSDFLIRVEGIGKAYRINSSKERDRTIGKTIFEIVHSPLIFIRRSFSEPLDGEVIWALRNVSFEVKPGEILGVLGRNGAGKSTLLKILSKVTLPTEGFAQTRGRIGSLLDIGTGFNPELTGRENVYHRGAILGMKQSEVDKKFDEIVDFSGVEKFIDTPVKRYSSGMNARLGFSVAILSEPDILLVDEVLSVGDAEFRQKSLERILNLVDQGVSILFVSHDIMTLKRVCTRALLLESGKLVSEGNLSEILEYYLPDISNLLLPCEWKDLATSHRQGSGEAIFSKISYRSHDQAPENQAYPDGSLEFLIEVNAVKNCTLEGVSVIFFDTSGNRLINAGLMKVVELVKGKNMLQLKIERLHLKSGTYSLGLWMVGNLNILLDQI